jgi:hypothetical protein
MADQQTNTGQSNFTQVVSLLRQAESLLSGVSNSDNTVANNTNASLRPPNSSTVTENLNVDSVPSVATTSTSSDRSLANFRLLFSSYNRGSFRQNSSRASSAPPTKRKRTLSQFVPKDMWTHEFFCLADRHQNYQPTRGQKCDLQLAGLGRKKIVSKKDGSSSAFVAKLEEYFPKLQNCGGFEILRSGATILAKIMWTPNCFIANNGNINIETLFHEICRPSGPCSMLFAAFKF